MLDVSQRRRCLGHAARTLASAFCLAGIAGLTACQDSGSPQPVSAPTVVSGRGALPEGEQASCSSACSPSEVAQRAFAFSGAVRSIGDSRTNCKGVELPLVSATFSVDRWFSGGSGPVVTIDIVDPKSRSSIEPAPFTVGTRLLVSGEHRWGETSDEDLLAWPCGFTRYYDPATVKQWQTATG